MGSSKTYATRAAKGAEKDEPKGGSTNGRKSSQRGHEDTENPIQAGQGGGTKGAGRETPQKNAKGGP